MQLPIDAYNLSTNDKWILVIPFKQIDESFSVDNIALNLTNFSLPELSMSQVEMPIMGSGCYDPKYRIVLLHSLFVSHHSSNTFCVLGAVSQKK